MVDITAGGDDLRHAVGHRIYKRREAVGLSRQRLANAIGVDKTTVAAWEACEYMPRVERRHALATALGIQVESLFADGPTDADTQGGSAALIDTIRDLPSLLTDLTRDAKQLNAFRLAAAYPTSKNVQTEWRLLIGDRIRSRKMEVLRIEICYNLQRLAEIVSNIIRFDGYPYYVKCYTPLSSGAVFPAFGGYIFDNNEVLLGAYWTGLPPSGKPSLRLSSGVFRAFFSAYWNEVWGRGLPLNMQGKTDLSGPRQLAQQLGLAPGKWNEFVEHASAYEVGDGAPPLI